MKRIARRKKGLGGKMLLPWLFLLSFLPCAAPAHEALKPQRTPLPPVINGVLDDAVWREAQEISGFKSFIPDFGKDASEQTTAYMAYDAEYLYFAFDCRDRSADKIKATMASRDAIMTDDFVCINLDSFNDQQASYGFYVNPLGIQGDSRYAGNVEDFSVDFVWSSAGRLGPDGYAVELRIPFKSIRYAGKERLEMGIIFERYVSRSTEHWSFPELDPAKGYAFLSQMQPLELHDIRRYTLLEVLPSIVFNRSHERREGRLQLSESQGEFGVTAKLGLTSKLILDLTWNPDFSQVESDAGQVDANLRSDLFYSEKRPFFLEGSDIFQLAGSSPFQAAVHTRQIVDPLLGFKLSGKLGSKDTLAAIFSLDEVRDNPWHDPAGADHAGFYILRYKRSLKDDSYAGVFYAGREQGNDFNRLAGLDGQLRLSASSTLGFHGFASFTNNPTLPEKKGLALNADYAYSTRDLDIAGGAFLIGRDFFSESGYLTRSGLSGIEAEVSPKFYPGSGFFRKLKPRVTGAVYRDHESGMNESLGKLGIDFLLPGNTALTLEAWAANEIFLGRRFNISSCRLIANSWLSKKLYLYLAFRRGNQIRYVADPFQGYGNTIAGIVRYLPTDHLAGEVRLSYADLFAWADGLKVYGYAILRNKLTYQLNKYLFFRGVLEYNDYRNKILGDLLLSFTYIPGTVIQLGYGSLYEKVGWEENGYRPDDRFLEMKRGFFFKASYLWRL